MNQTEAALNNLEHHSDEDDNDAGIVAGTEVDNQSCQGSYDEKRVEDIPRLEVFVFGRTGHSVMRTDGILRFRLLPLIYLIVHR